jgi:8-oxo-dGTP pyrophosphatase MutT (NUDIX family)
MSKYTPFNPHQSRGAGVMFMATYSGRFLLNRRAVDSPFPDTWAAFGGRGEFNETAQETAIREFFEETGHRIDSEMEHLFHFEYPNFTFDTFLATSEREFNPHLTSEASDFCWTTLEDIPEKIHEGLRSILEDRITVNRLIKFVEKNSGRPCDFDRIFKQPTEI